MSEMKPISLRSKLSIVIFPILIIFLFLTFSSGHAVIESVDQPADLKMDASFLEIIEEMDGEAAYSIIVQASSEFQSSEIAKEIAVQYGAVVKSDLAIINGFALENASPELVKVLAAHPSVKYVSDNLLIQSASVDATPVTKLETIEVSFAKNDGWKVVHLKNNYDNLVVACTPQYKRADGPLVVRLDEALTGNQFKIRVQSPQSPSRGGAATVQCLVSEQGVWKLDDGTVFEAQRYLADEPQNKRTFSRKATRQQFNYSFNYPVVIGQVMSSNDQDWSAFWAHGGRFNHSVSRTQFFAGYHVGQDTDTSRNSEHIGYFVFERQRGDTLYATHWGHYKSIKPSQIVLASNNGALRKIPRVPFVDLSSSSPRVRPDSDGLTSRRDHRSERIGLVTFPGHIEIVEPAQLVESTQSAVAKSIQDASIFKAINNDQVEVEGYTYLSRTVTYDVGGMYDQLDFKAETRGMQ